VTLLGDLLPAFLATALALPALAGLAPPLGLVDTPSARSTHARPVARVGGIGLLAGMLTAVAVLALRAHGALDAAGAWLPYGLPALLFFLIGLADDRWRLSARPKLLAQAAVAALAVVLGLRWGGAAAGPFGALDFGALTPVMTWLWIVAVVTLVNFVDGIDLITACVTVVVLGAAAGAQAGPGDGMLHALAAAALLGVVLFNVSPARLFLGDAGTHLLGFLVAAAALGLPAAGPRAPVALPWVLASAPLLPAVIDVALALVSKARRGVPLAAAHSDHLHQRLTKAGWSHPASALRYGALALLALLMVTEVARGAGLVACLAISAVVLAMHLGTALHTTRGVAWSPHVRGGTGR
jgi:UDP-GlcNAc:undecaprenyl-phosphate GlcNAc-1-phosphate transferase